jgi:hypothetical protein
MIGQNKFHGQAPHPIDAVRLCLDYHPFRHSGHTGRRQTFHPIDFDNAQSTVSDWPQVGMMAKMGNVDAGSERRFKNGSAFFCPHVTVVYGQVNAFHDFNQDRNLTSKGQPCRS